MGESSQIELILFDVGGVLGTNGWDHAERAAAARQFGMDRDAFELRHADAVDTWEAGDMTIDEYLDFAVFDVARPFTRDDFKSFMFAQSIPTPESLDIARSLAATGRYRMMTMNNESAELHEHRVRRFGLDAIFEAFLTSAYLAARKPHDVFYNRALAVSRAVPQRTVFIDDREENLAPVRARRIQCVHATGPASIRDGLAALGVSANQ